MRPVGQPLQLAGGCRGSAPEALTAPERPCGSRPGRTPLEPRGTGWVAPQVRAAAWPIRFRRAPSWMGVHDNAVGNAGWGGGSRSPSLT